MVRRWAAAMVCANVALALRSSSVTARSLATPRPGAAAVGTTLPGVFAAGDVRYGSVKRVAAAVGEGATAVRFVHEYLAAEGTDVEGSSSATR
jgi:thioredoxin reductase (NADPH)